MKRLKVHFLFIIILICILTACIKSQPQSTQTTQYEGRALSIGIIGEVPTVQEEQVKFTTIQFSDLEKGTFASLYDAIFIIEDNMPEGTQAKYTTFCKNSKIPFFFSEMERVGDDQTYATGYLETHKRVVSWGYSLFNNIDNEKNVKDIFSQIFDTISENTVPKRNEISS